MDSEKAFDYNFIHSDKTVEEIHKVLEMQEEILQFSHFTNRDAIELGSFMLEEARKKELSIALSIRRSNGAIVFQAMMDGRTPENLMWIERKFNTVIHEEMSSLRWFMQLKNNEETMADKFMDESVYACCGGGFPIRIEEAGVVGAILVSGMNHVQDHDYIVRILSKYLHMDEVPRITEVR